MESVKAASDVYMPITGTITAVNTALESAPEAINADPFAAGWIIKFAPADRKFLTADLGHVSSMRRKLAIISAVCSIVRQSELTLFMSTSKIKAAVIGVGVGWNHVEGYQTHPDVDLVGICDSTRQFSKNAATNSTSRSPAALRHFDDHDRGHSTGSTPSASRCPTYLHEPVALKCLKHGMNVLCEKPLPPTPTGATHRRCRAAANKTLMVCYNHRYRPEIVWLKDQIQSGEFGHIYAAKAGWMREGWIPTHGAVVHPERRAPAAGR